MKRETIAIHSGYDVEPTTKSVAVPIYQTVACGSTAQAAPLLTNLETEGFRYSRISNPTNAVLERRVAALEGGVEALSVSSGQAAINYAVANVTELGCNIVSVPAKTSPAPRTRCSITCSAGRASTLDLPRPIPPTRSGG